jgi:mannose/fructose-specific phosphotransferase system component IIA
MSEEICGVLVGHGRLAEGLLDAVEAIAGERGGLVPLDNQDLTSESLEDRLAEIAGGRPTVLFVDLPSGSCAVAARRLQRRLQAERVAVVCGVNLPLLLDFVFHRSLPLSELVKRLRTHVGVSIEHRTDGDRTVSGG